MAEWNRRREPDVHDVMTCRGVLRCAATRDAPRRARAPAPAPRAPAPAEAARRTVVVAGLGVAGCAAARSLRRRLGAAVRLRCVDAAPRLGAGGGLRSDDAGRDVGALRLSFDGARAPCCDALAGAAKERDVPNSRAPISAVFHSFRLTFGRGIISRNGLEAWMLFPERARAARSR